MRTDLSQYPDIRLFVEHANFRSVRSAEPQRRIANRHARAGHGSQHGILMKAFRVDLVMPRSKIALPVRHFLDITRVDPTLDEKGLPVPPQFDSDGVASRPLPAQRGTPVALTQIKTEHYRS